MRAPSSGGPSDELLSEVRWLQWQVWPWQSESLLSTTGLHLPNLSVLDLSGSWDITEDWEGWRGSFTTAKRLRVLDLEGCEGLRCTPDLSAFTQLKILTLSGCFDLEHLHPSIGKLKSLVSLELALCGSLKELPEEVGELKDLEELQLGRSGITEIPTSIGSLSKLKKLSASSCSGLERLPTAIGRLKNLRTLRLDSCRSLKGAIPSEIGDLSSLEVLDFSQSPISDLPEQLPSGLTDLRVSCRRRRLPQLSSLIHLEQLHLQACHLLEDIPELPSRLLKLSVWECGKLKLLKLDGCKYLETLQITRCSSIERLLCPESRCLKNLATVECNNLVEIQGLHGAKFLKALDFTGCESMEMLPNLTGCEKLQCLIVRNCKKLTQLWGLEKLDLIDLDISGCDSLEAIPKLSGTRVLRNYERELSYNSWSDDSSTESD